MRARRILSQKLSREPVLREIAKESGFTEAKVRDLLELIEDPISLETPVGDGESVYSDLIEDENADCPRTRPRGMRSTELAEALTRLNPRMRLVLARASASTASAADARAGRLELGITRERVRQLETRALASCARRPSSPVSQNA
jgi:RNA polymerase primary sigma factor